MDNIAYIDGLIGIEYRDYSSEHTKAWHYTGSSFFSTTMVMAISLNIIGIDCKGLHFNINLERCGGMVLKPCIYLVMEGVVKSKLGIV